MPPTEPHSFCALKPVNTCSTSAHWNEPKLTSPSRHPFQNVRQALLASTAASCRWANGMPTICSCGNNCMLFRSWSCIRHVGRSTIVQKTCALNALLLHAHDLGNGHVVQSSMICATFHDFLHDGLNSALKCALVECVWITFTVSS